MIARRESQEESFKVTQFARPPSSHDDSPVAFTFMKPKLPQMDFSRKPTQNSVAAAQRTTQETSVNTPQQFSPLNAGGNAKAVSSHFPLLKFTQSSVNTDSTPPPVNHQEAVSAREDLVVDPDISNVSSRHSSKVPEVADVPESPRLVPQPLEISKEKSKNRYNQQNRRSRVSMINLEGTSQKISEPIMSPLPNHRSSLSDEDLLNVLLLRQRAQQEQRDLFRANEAAKDQEIGDLREVSHNLYQKLQHLQDQDKAKEIEISRLHAVVPRWEKKIQSLSRCLNTLLQDHRELMGSSKELKRKQEDVQAEKAGLVLMLKDLQEAVRSDRGKYSVINKVLLEARNHIGLLEQRIKDHESKSREDEGLLREERHRVQKLEAEIDKLTTTYHALTTAATNHRDTILEKLSKVLDIGIEAMGATQAQSQFELKALVNQCVDMLQKVHTMETVKPQDIRNLDNFIRSFAQR